MPDLFVEMLLRGGQMKTTKRYMFTVLVPRKNCLTSERKAQEFQGSIYEVRHLDNDRIVTYTFKTSIDRASFMNWSRQNDYKTLSTIER